MFVERHTVSVTTATDGTGTGYTPAVTGRVLGIHYIADASAPYTASLATVAVTSEAVGATILSRTATGSFDVLPRLFVQTSTGATTMLEPLAISNDRVKIAVASGGATKTGRFDVVVG